MSRHEFLFQAPVHEFQFYHESQFFSLTLVIVQVLISFSESTVFKFLCPDPVEDIYFPISTFF